MSQFSHLYAIEARIDNEKARLSKATTQREKLFREHEIRMAEKERAGEIAFLEKQGIKVFVAEAMSDDELLAELIG